jgi:CspA family cold shock protein
MAIATANVGAAQTGRVKKVVQERGFGFITGDDGKEYFFHRSELELGLSFDRLVGGERVTFSVEPGPKGLRAVRIRAPQPGARP